MGYHLSAPVAPQPNKLSLSWLLQVQGGNGFYDQNWENSESMVEEVLSKCTVFTFLCLTLAFFKFCINFSIIMGTSVQKNFFFFFFLGM